MSFLIYDIFFLIAFCLFIIIFLYLKRKNVKREGILFLYKTQLGIRVINYIGKKYKKFLAKFEYVLIFFGYALMAAALYLVFHLVYLFTKPEFVKAAKIPPIVPLVPYITSIFKVDYLPVFYFTYWIVVLFIAATPHEFFHGIFARIHNIKIKSTGFAFLGPFAGAFVEPDESKVKKVRKRSQIAFLSAGSFANLIFGILFFLLMYLFFISFFSPSGMIFNDYTKAIVNISDIQIVEPEVKSVNIETGLNLTEIKVQDKNYFIKSESLAKLKNSEASQAAVYENTPALKVGLNGIIIEFDGKKISTYEDFEKEISKKVPNETISIKTSFNGVIKEYKIPLAENPGNKSLGYLGIAVTNPKSLSSVGRVIMKLSFFRDTNTEYSSRFKSKIIADLIIFVYNLILWIILVCFSVAIANMLPVGIFDGGRVFYLTVLGLTKSEKTAKRAYKIVTFLFLFVLFLLMYFWFSSTFLR